VVGLVTVFQLAPFHRNITPEVPTIHPSVELTINTAIREFVVGLVTVFQLAPFHRNIVPL
jgi:hypothetical protein